jgi:hypothetical protein
MDFDENCVANLNFPVFGSERQQNYGREQLPVFRGSWQWKKKTVDTKLADF